MIFRQIRVLLAFTFVIFLAACSTAPQKQTYADITFQHLSQIKLDVNEIKVVNEFKASLNPPHVEHELPIKIDQSIRRWVQDRLQPVGRSGSYAALTIRDASAVEQLMEKSTGLKGLFTKDQSELYKFHIAVELNVVSVNGSKALATAEATRSKSVSEDITLNDRERMYFEQTEILMQEFDLEMEKNIRAFLGQYIR